MVFDDTQACVLTQGGYRWIVFQNRRFIRQVTYRSTIFIGTLCSRLIGNLARINIGSGNDITCSVNPSFIHIQFIICIVITGNISNGHHWIGSFEQWIGYLNIRQRNVSLISHSECISDCFTGISTLVTVPIYKQSRFYNGNCRCWCLLHQDIHSSVIGCNWASVVIYYINKLISPSKSGVGSIGEGTVGINNQRTIGWANYWSKGSIYRLVIAFRVAIVIQNVSGNWCINFTVIGIVVSNRNISVVRYHGDGHGRRVAQCGCTVITDGIFKSILALKSGVRDIGIASVGVYCYRSVGRIGIGSYHNGVSIQIKIVHQNISGNWSIHFRSIGIIICHRGIVSNYWIIDYFNGYGSCITSNRISTIANLIFEAVLTYEVGVWSISIAAIGVEDQGTVGRATACHQGEDLRARWAIGVLIVGCHAAAYRKVHEGVVDVVDGKDIVSWITNGKVNRCLIGSHGASVVEDSVHELIGALEARIGRIGKASIGVDYHCSVGWATYWACCIHSLCITFWVAIIVKHVTGDGHVRISVVGIVIGHGNITVVRYHGDGHGRRVAQCGCTVITDGIFKSILALKSGVRDIGIASVRVYRHRSV